MTLTDPPSAPRSITQLSRQRAQWFEQLLALNGFWDMTTLTDVLTGEVYFSREAYVVSATAVYESKFRAHLELAKGVNLTIKALPQTTLGQLTLIIKPAELDVSVKDNSPFASHPD